MAKPITPEEVTLKRVEKFPAYVIEAFNTLIQDHWINMQASFTQDEVVERILKYAPMQGTKLTRAQVFEHRLLDVEDIFRAAGWGVEYDKPGFNETGAARFTFKRRTRG